MSARWSLAKEIAICVAGMMIAAACGNGGAANKTDKGMMEQSGIGQPAEKSHLAAAHGPGTYAAFNTSAGRIVCRLFSDKAPLTCENFIGLAEGTKEWTDPKTGRQVKRPFYDGLTFHRIAPNFMIQGGCPLGNGKGGPGYNFKDEFDPSVRFDRPGLLAMANSGPGTNGSQFFITEAPTPHLDMKHTIFGELVEGMDIVKIIARGRADKDLLALEPIVIEKLEIVRVEE